MKCPHCKATRFQYAFNTRPAGVMIAVQCQHCGLMGPEARMSSENDSAAAEEAAREFVKLAAPPAPVIPLALPRRRAVH